MSKENESLLIDFEEKINAVDEPKSNSTKNSKKKETTKEKPAPEKQKTGKKSKGFLIGLSIFSALALAGGASFFAISTININNTINKKYTIKKEEQNCQIYVRDKDKNIVNDFKANSNLEIEVSGIKEGYIIKHVYIFNSNYEYLYSLALDNVNKCELIAPNSDIIIAAWAIEDKEIYDLYYFNLDQGVFSVDFKNKSGETITSASVGEKVILNINLELGYTIDSVYQNNEKISKGTSGNYEFEMPPSPVVITVKTSAPIEQHIYATFRMTIDQATDGVKINNDIVPVVCEFTSPTIYEYITDKPSATKTDSFFVGWTTENMKVDDIIPLTHVINTNETYYPFFILNTEIIQVSYNFGEYGESTTTSIDTAKGQKVETLKLITPTIKEQYKDQYVFDYWSWTDPSGTPTKVNPTDVFDDESHNKLYAVYTEKK